MEPLKIPSTPDTPEVDFNKETGRFQISGRSLTDNPQDFYQSVLAWLKAYCAAPNSETNLIFKFEYINVQSSKSVLDILTTIEGIKGVKVCWYFNEEDEDMEEIGEEIAELVQIPFEFKHH